MVKKSSIYADIYDNDDNDNDGGKFSILTRECKNGGPSSILFLQTVLYFHTLLCSIIVKY